MVTEEETTKGGKIAEKKLCGKKRYYHPKKILKKIQFRHLPALLPLSSKKKRRKIAVNRQLSI